MAQRTAYALQRVSELIMEEFGENMTFVLVVQPTGLDMQGVVHAATDGGFNGFTTVGVLEELKLQVLDMTGRPGDA